MTESSEKSIQRSYSDLSASEKVQAILGAVKEPVSRSLALDFSGVNYDELSESERGKIDAIFQGDNVDRTKVENDQRYSLKPEAIVELSDSVDMKSVHKQMTDKMLGNLGIDLDF